MAVSPEPESFPQHNASSLSSQELVERIRRGDLTAEAELVRRFSRGVSAIVRRSSRDRSAVEDVCQETFRVALEKLRRGDMREPHKLPGFIAALARNLVIDHFRRLPRHRMDAGAPGEPIDSSPNPLDALLQKEQSTIVRQVLAELDTERDRQILFRYYVAEEDKERICSDLGLTSLHFNRVLFRARERYRTLYEQMASSR